MFLLYFNTTLYIITLSCGKIFKMWKRGPVPNGLIYNKLRQDERAKFINVRGLPLITYAPRGRGGQASYTFLLRITYKKGVRGPISM